MNVNFLHKSQRVNQCSLMTAEELHFSATAVPRSANQNDKGDIPIIPTGQGHKTAKSLKTTFADIQIPRQFYLWTLNTFKLFHLRTVKNLKWNQIWPIVYMKKRIITSRYYFEIYKNMYSDNIPSFLFPKSCFSQLNNLKGILAYRDSLYVRDTKSCWLNQ